jgi:hypothetical protein
LFQLDADFLDQPLSTDIYSKRLLYCRGYLVSDKAGTFLQHTVLLLEGVYLPFVDRVL